MVIVNTLASRSAYRRDNVAISQYTLLDMNIWSNYNMKCIYFRCFTIIEESRHRRSKETSETGKEESKGFLSTIQEKAASLFQRITGESEEAKSPSSQRERRGGRRRPRSENSEDERRERRRRRQRRRIRNEDGDESTSLVRQRRHRRNRGHSQEGDSRNQNTELAIVHYEPRRRNMPESKNNEIS